MRQFSNLGRVLAFVGVVVALGCARGASPPPTSGGIGSLSDAELRYGMPPSHGSNIVYQDDVIVFDRGPEAVHSVSSNGLTWTIDASAPNAQELQPGKIMFLTSRAVGRVLGVQRTGDELAVTLGPVEITDVIKEAHVSFNQPIDLSSMVAYTAPDYPNAIGELANTSQVGQPIPVGQFIPDELAQPDAFDSAFALPALAGPVLGPPSQINISDFAFKPFCCGGIGLGMVYDKGGVTVRAKMTVYLDTPSLRFNLDITHGKIVTAELELTGVAGVAIKFEAGSTVGVNGNIKTKPLWIPVDLSLPILGNPPFAVTLQQQFLITTGFSARNSTLTASGDYAFKGSFYMGYHNGSWSAGAPLSFIVRQSLPDSINGISLGATGFVMGYQARVIVGIGAFGFVTGPYFGYGMGIGIVQGAGAAALAGPPCRAATFDVDLHVGVGYSMPRPLTSAINFILRKLNLSEIQGTGGIDHREKLIHKHDAIPKGSSCGGSGP